jgi:GMP synthase-like glutamine amidotransferase
MVGMPQAFGQDAKARPSKGKLLPIKNGGFAAATKGKQPVADWTFQALTCNVEGGAKEGKATAVVPEDGQGVVLRGMSNTTRGDLVSAPIHLDPFRWVRVRVKYAVESGEPLVLVCLRPTENRSLVDLAFLPGGAPAKKRKATVKLHTGSLDGDYSISVSILGKGSARVLELKAKEAGDYPRPTKPALVIDLMHDRPVTRGPNAWEDVQKLATVNGFPSVEFMSYTEVTPEKLKEVDPSLVLFSAFADSSQNPDRRKVIQAVRTAARFEAPLLSIALGHQMLARAEGATRMDRVPEYGPTRLEVVSDDPIFAGLPRHPYFFATESHNYIVSDVPSGAEVIAASEKVLTQAFRYPELRCYSFMGNIESEWEYCCPEACIVWKNVLRQWKLAPPMDG